MKKKVQYILPNILTLSRIFAIPLIVICFFMNKSWSFMPAAIVFIFASITDFFDGYLARHWSVQSKFGTMMDPVADKVIIVTTTFMIVEYKDIDKLTLVSFLIIVCREILVSGLREFAATENLRIYVNFAGKIKTAIQMLSLLILIVGNNESYVALIGSFGIWLSAVFSIYSAIIYCKKIKSIVT